MCAAAIEVFLVHGIPGALSLNLRHAQITQPGWVAAGRVSPVVITGIQQVPGSLVFAAKASIESAKSFTFNLTNSFPSQSE